MTISDKLTTINNALNSIKQAIISKGQTITGDITTYSDAIDDIQTGGTITSLTVTPSTTQQVITAPSGTDGYNPITVDAVTSSIDSNIVAGNIKDGVSILGVTGTYTGGGSSGVGIPREVNSSGVYTLPVNNFTFSLPSSVTNVGDNALYYAFRNCATLTSVDLSNLTTVSGMYALYHGFGGSSNLTSVDLSNLTTLSGDYALNYAFDNCTSLTSVDLSNLTTVSGNSALSYVFQDCTNLTSIDLSGLTTVSGNNALSNAFRSCTSLVSVDLSGLTTLRGNNALNYAFRYCGRLTSLSFNSLTSTSFGTYNTQFNNMLGNITGCTVHFPSNLQSVIGSWSSVTGGFGGTNTTVLFDLPATT